MLLFDWNKIVKESGGKAKKAFDILHHITFKTVPKNRKDVVYSFYGKDFFGSSFLIHPEDILLLQAVHYTRVDRICKTS